jgi:hypothetical protein
MLVYQLIVTLSKLYSISKSSFYAWKRQETYRLTPEKVEKSEQVKAVFIDHRRRYGAKP